MSDYPLLDRITSPHQLRRLTEDELSRLAGELRKKIIQVVSHRGGHLASNLGIAELTIALHYVFDFSHDRLLWDVGHQCYAHKIITGRGGQRFDMLRQAGGISGFPSPTESPYDLFHTGHAGTAISTAAGLAWADQMAKQSTHVVAVVGDASIVNGLSLEGINNAAMLQRQFLIVLNDNSMAIDRTRGALAAALDRLRMTHTYKDFKQSTENILHHLPMGGEISEALRNLKAGLKTTIHGGQIFEALGFQYFGPVDGHDVHGLIRALKRLAGINHPVLLHVHTQKGRGAEYAVEDPCRFHSPSAYTMENGKAVFSEKGRPAWTSAFADALTDLAAKDERIVAITAAMPDGTGLTKFRKAFPSRYIDVGINESHAVAMAAGLAKAGLRPVVAVYSTFMQRAYDQVFQELCLQDLPVVLCMDRAGLVGSDGAVHHGFADIAFLRSLPGMTLLAPADGPEMAAALQFALAQNGPTAIRYPRDEVPEDLAGACPPFEIGRARIVFGPGAPAAAPQLPASAGASAPAASAQQTAPAVQKMDAAILAYGAMVEPALAAAEKLARKGLEICVVNARFAKPLDAALIGRLISSGKPLLVVEDHAVVGGLGSAVMELAAARGLGAAAVRLLGLPDRFISHATRAQQLLEAGLDSDTIAATAADMIEASRKKTSRQYL